MQMIDYENTFYVFLKKDEDYQQAVMFAAFVYTEFLSAKRYYRQIEAYGDVNLLPAQEYLDNLRNTYHKAEKSVNAHFNRVNKAYHAQFG